MDLVNFSVTVQKISSLPSVAVVLIAVLAACAIAGACVYVYTGICAAVETWSENRTRRVRREAWIGAHVHQRRADSPRRTASCLPSPHDENAPGAERLAEATKDHSQRMRSLANAAFTQ